MQTLVKIIRSSIKKNPDAGKNVTYQTGTREITFEAKGKLPDYFKDEENVIITAWSHDGSFTNGIILDPSLCDRVSKEKNLNINIKDERNIVPLYHPPLPQYLYSYENTKIECNNCHNKIHVKEIIQDCNDDGCYDECPICNHIDTFQYSYENIEAVIKENPELLQ